MPPARRERRRPQGGTWFDCFSRVCASPPRVVNSAEQITEMGRLARALVRFLRHPWRLLRAGGRFRDSENKGRAARMAGSLNHIAATDLRVASREKYNRANITGHRPGAVLGWSFSSSWACLPAGRPISREVNRGRAANVAPSPVYRLLSVFSPRTWLLPPGK